MSFLGVMDPGFIFIYSLWLGVVQFYCMRWISPALCNVITSGAVLLVDLLVSDSLIVVWLEFYIRMAYGSTPDVVHSILGLLWRQSEFRESF
jgi:hypothetical protein